MEFVYVFEGERGYKIDQNRTKLPREFWIIINVVKTVSRRETRAGGEGVHSGTR